ncbi:MAG: hypothetical protein JOZ70_01890 [Pseudolabrys sp.]|nr:hypothetical protein [Pseudolabrys sp.]
MKSATLIGALLGAALMAGCSGQAPNEMRATAVAPLGVPAAAEPGIGGPTPAQAAAVSARAKPVAAKPDDDDPGPPLEKHEITAMCWMKIDKQRLGSDAARTAAVDKCIAERKAGGR